MRSKVVVLVVLCSSVPGLAPVWGDTAPLSSAPAGEASSAASVKDERAEQSPAAESQAGVEKQAQTPVLPFKYVGNSFSNKFHRPSCPFARIMSASHIIYFEHRHDAIEKGYLPCHYCLPADWKTVNAVILPQSRNGEDSRSAAAPKGL